MDKETDPSHGGLYLQKLVLDGVFDQLGAEAPLPAGQVIGGDAVRDLGGVQGLLQTGLQEQQQLRLRQQPVCQQPDGLGLGLV